MDDDWTPRVAEEAAGEVGIVLTEKHWRVIAESREWIARRGHAPSLEEVSARCGVPLAEINELFPGGAEEILARLTGAPELKRRRAS